MPGNYLDENSGRGGRRVRGRGKKSDDEGDKPEDPTIKKDEVDQNQSDDWDNDEN